MTDIVSAHPIAGLGMYDWPEVHADVDELWSHIAAACARHDVEAPPRLSRFDTHDALWRNPAMLVGQVCSLNPVRDGLGETEVIGTLAYQPPCDLPACGPGDYYSVIVVRSDDPATGSVDEFDRLAGYRVAANGEDSQSGYWSLGHLAAQHGDGVRLGDVAFTGSHRDSVIAVASGAADIAAIDVHSWRLARLFEPDAVGRLRVIGTTPPTPGVVCVVSWEQRLLKGALDDAIRDGVERFVSTPAAQRLAITGYRSRSLDEFACVAQQVERVDQTVWNAAAAR